MSGDNKMLLGQKDLLLKLAMQKYFWRLEYTTMLNVPLRSYHAKQRNEASGAAFEEFTDLDVLGISVSREARVDTVIGDCKTSERRSTERMFWLKGVAHLFNARTAYLVRTKDVTRAARQLANRLDLSVITEADFDSLSAIHPGDAAIDWGALDSLSSVEATTREQRLMQSIDKSLYPALDYLRSDYWVYSNHRNLLQLVAHLNDAARFLDQRNPAHRALFLRAVTLYALTLCHATAHIRSGHLRSIENSLDEYFFGGPVSLNEKRNLALILEQFAPPSYDRNTLDPFPPWYAGLREIVTRFVRRSESLHRVIQYSEFARLHEIERRAFIPGDIFRDSFDPIALKLLIDTCNFLITASHLDARWKALTDGYLSSSTSNQPLLESRHQRTTSAVQNPEGIAIPLLPTEGVPPDSVPNDAK